VVRSWASTCAPDVAVRGARLGVGDLMRTGLPSGACGYVTCLSVIEHEVDFARFAAEAARLLADGGRLYVTFDFWEPRVVTRGKLYGLAWQPLDAAAVLAFLAACAEHGLRLAGAMDWTLGDPVIDEGYYSPQAGVRYTFGLAAFDKHAR
jgi:SAM-dependent methyltransferase